MMAKFPRGKLNNLLTGLFKIFAVLTAIFLKNFANSMLPVKFLSA